MNFNNNKRTTTILGNAHFPKSNMAKLKYLSEMQNSTLVDSPFRSQPRPASPVANPQNNQTIQPSTSGQYIQYFQQPNTQVNLVPIQKVQTVHVQNQLNGNLVYQPQYIMTNLQNPQQLMDNNSIIGERLVAVPVSQSGYQNPVIRTNFTGQGQILIQQDTNQQDSQRIRFIQSPSIIHIPQVTNQVSYAQQPQMTNKYRINQANYTNQPHYVNQSIGNAQAYQQNSVLTQPQMVNQNPIHQQENIQIGYGNQPVSMRNQRNASPVNFAFQTQNTNNQQYVNNNETNQTSFYQGPPPQTRHKPREESCFSDLFRSLRKKEAERLASLANQSENNQQNISQVSLTSLNHDYKNQQYMGQTGLSSQPRTVEQSMGYPGVIVQSQNIQQCVDDPNVSNVSNNLNYQKHEQYVNLNNQPQNSQQNMVYNSFAGQAQNVQQSTDNMSLASVILSTPKYARKLHFNSQPQTLQAEINQLSITGQPQSFVKKQRMENICFTSQPHLTNRSSNQTQEMKHAIFSTQQTKQVYTNNPFLINQKQGNMKHNQESKNFNYGSTTSQVAPLERSNNELGESGHSPSKLLLSSFVEINGQRFPQYTLQTDDVVVQSDMQNNCLQIRENQPCSTNSFPTYQNELTHINRRNVVNEGTGEFVLLEETYDHLKMVKDILVTDVMESDGATRQ